jgi:hypothetical protein
MTPANEHPSHMIVATITKYDLALIVEYHHHKIAPSPKCAARAAMATTSTYTEHHLMMTRKDV